MKLQLLAAAAAALALAGAPAHAQSARYAFGVGAGTAGLEAQGAYGVSDWLSLRAGGTFLDYDQDDVDLDGVDYDATLEASTFAGFVDVRPFANGLTVTGGAYIGPREASLSGAPTEDVEIGGVTFTPGEVGRLVGDMDLGDFAPFIGIGYDNTFTTYGWLGLRLGAGVAFGPEPNVTLTSVEGALSFDPTLQDALRVEAENIAEDAQLLRYYPVLSAGLFVKF